MEGYGISAVYGIHPTLAIHREVQQQCGIVPYRFIIQVCQLLWCLHLRILLRVIEPTRTDGYIALGRNPAVAVRMTCCQLFALVITRIDYILAQERPIGSACLAPLVAYPTAPWTSIAEDDGLWLMLLYDGVNLGVVVIVAMVNLALLPGPSVVAVATIGTVQPHLEERTVLRNQLRQLLVVVIHIGLTSVFSMVSVPRRQIDAHLQAVFVASLS